MAGLVLSVSLLLDGKATAQVTQVSLDQCLDDVATAQQELVTAADADPPVVPRPAQPSAPPSTPWWHSVTVAPTSSALTTSRGCVRRRSRWQTW